MHAHLQLSVYYIMVMSFNWFTIFRKFCLNEKINIIVKFSLNH